VNTASIEIEREKYRAEELSNVENGITRVKLRVKRQDKCKVDAIIGKKIIESFKALITREGDPIICYYCEQYGHLQTNCEERIRKRNLQCGKCYRKGHTTEDCNLARGINAQNEQDDDEELEDAFDEGSEHASK
jgi:hypothetical protein